MKRSPLKQARIRQLRQGEPVPGGEPKRYENAKGYVRLRWKVGPHEYVEIYERDASGSLVRHQDSEVKRLDHEAIARLHDAGLSTVAISKALDCDSSSVSRSLRGRGRVPRGRSHYAQDVDEDEVLRRYAAGEGYSSIRSDLGVSAERVKRILVEHGVDLRGVGRVERPVEEVSYNTEFERMKPLVRERSRGRCEAMVSLRCTGRGTHVHHRKLRSQGGKNDLVTLVDVCMWCHSHIHANPRQSFEKGFLVSSTADPAAIPIRPWRGTKDVFLGHGDSD